MIYKLKQAILKWLGIDSLPNRMIAMEKRADVLIASVNSLDMWAAALPVVKPKGSK